MISLRPDHQKSNEENDRLKNYEPEVVTCEYHKNAAKKHKHKPKNPTSWPMDITQRTSKSRSKYRVVTKSGAKGLNFDHISQLNWESEQKKGIVEKKKEKKDRPKMESFVRNHQQIKI